MATMYATLATSSVRLAAPAAWIARSRNAFGCSSAIQGLALRSPFHGEKPSISSRGEEQSVRGVREKGMHCMPRASVSEYAPLAAILYGASLLGGGLYAYTKTGSTGSLGGGVTGGIALGVAFFLMQVPETQDLGQAVGFGAAVLFAAVFAIRLASTGKPIPSVPLLGLSAATSLVFALSYLQTRVLLP